MKCHSKRTHALAHSFNVNNETGVLSVAKSLDREATAVYSLTVTAMDSDPDAPREGGREEEKDGWSAFLSFAYRSMLQILTVKIVPTF